MRRGQPDTSIEDPIQNQSGDVARQSHSPAETAPKSVTQNPVGRSATSAQKIIQKAGTPTSSVSPTEQLFRKRRRAAVTQAEIARVIRAAKQAGAAEVELRLTDSSRIIVHLNDENSATDEGEIIL